MAEDHALVQWRKRYARLLWRYQTIHHDLDHVTGLKNVVAAGEKMERERAALKVTLEQLAARIRGADPDWDPKRVVPVRPRTKTIEHGNYALLAYGILAQVEEPITSREIALKIASELGEPNPDTRRLAHLTGVVNNLLRGKRGTLVQAIGEKPVRGKPLRWLPIPRDQVKLNRPTPRRRKRLEGRMPEDV